MDTNEGLQGICRDQEINGWRIKMYFWSRDIWLLAALAVVICSIAGGIGWFLQAPKKVREPLLASVKQAAPEESGKSTRGRSFLLESLDKREFPEGYDEEAVFGASNPSGTMSEEQQVDLAYRKSMRSADRLPSADLLFYAHWVKPFRKASESAADLYRQKGDVAAARKYYEREVRFHDADSARAKLVSMLEEHSDFTALSQLAGDPHYRAHISDHASILIVAREHRWRDLLQPLAKLELATWQPVPVTLAMVAGFAWLLVALQAVQPPGLFSFRIVVPLLAVGAGMVSTCPTLFAGLWEEEVFALRETGDFISDFLFYVAGVGPREELIKLLFFIPFVPFLLRRGSRLEMLIVAGCVGLGFAVEENLQYFLQAGPLAAFGRFLTANFFHLSATGVIGLSFCDALKAPREKGLQFLGTLAAVMLTHGFYDAFMAVAELQLLGLVSMVAFLLLSLYFFRQLRGLRDGATDQLSIAATLVIGISLLVGTMFICAARELGFELAGRALGTNVLSVGMIFYMFYWQLGDGMSAEEEAPRPAYSL